MMVDQAATTDRGALAGLERVDAVRKAPLLTRKHRSWLLRGLSIVFVLLLWEWAGRLPVGPTFPAFTTTMVAMVEMARDGSLFVAYVETLKAMVIGVGLCVAVGVGMGIVMGLSRRFEWVTLPVWVISQAAPMAAIIPVITYVYGVGVAAKVFAVVIMAAPIIVLNAYTGIRNVNKSIVEMSRSFLATRSQMVFKVILPAASGLIFAGFRLGMAQGLTGAVLAELMITPTGIGDLITYNRSVADYPRMFAAVFSIIIFASVAVTLLQKAEVRFFRPDQRRSQ